jgi:hypothetical protein
MYLKVENLKNLNLWLILFSLENLIEVKVIFGRK